MACMYNGRSYAEGSLTCQNGREMKCRGGEWQETGYPCSPNTAVQPELGGEPAHQMNQGTRSHEPDAAG